ncbi:hypothetical protein [Roseimarinus sediminis]|uniref:hypothetical protein n=1 Tax=Roseimarinus sediminis TaxID=1610899 RepID=UPI003D1BD666
MAEVKSNLATKGLSGMIGKTLVFRQSFGKTYVSAAPVRSEQEPTAVQLEHRGRFQEAVFYAKAAIHEAETKDAYAAVAEKRQLRSGYMVAVADYFHAPDIKEVDLDAYTGVAGDLITIKVTDDFKVKWVTVEIYESDGTLLEQGAAVESPDGLSWVYAATAENSSREGDRIVVKASDLPGNVSENETTLS